MARRELAEVIESKYTCSGGCTVEIMMIVIEIMIFVTGAMFIEQSNILKWVSI